MPVSLNSLPAGASAFCRATYWNDHIDWQMWEATFFIPAILCDGWSSFPVHIPHHWKQINDGYLIDRVFKAFVAATRQFSKAHNSEGVDVRINVVPLCTQPVPNEYSLHHS
jgi:hypothetical protein